jgi:hypothetical protein
MKFQKEFLSFQEKIHEEALLRSCIPYKFWKKYIKRHKEQLDPQEIIPLLEKQCKKTERIFQKKIAILTDTSLVSCLFHKNRITVEELFSYSEINKKALYKICKKLQKNGAKNLLTYFMTLRSSHKYHFMDSAEKEYLRLWKEPMIECPICLEEEEIEFPMIIFQCGHSMCFSCYCKITNIDHIRGTLYNRMLQKNTCICPICRFPMGIDVTKPYHFFPKPPLNHIL